MCSKGDQEVYKRANKGFDKFCNLRNRYFCIAVLIFIEIERFSHDIPNNNFPDSNTLAIVLGVLSGVSIIASFFKSEMAMVSLLLLMTRVSIN